jgi:hypothetical protein
MMRRLESAGFSVERIPMADLTREQLAAWIEGKRSINRSLAAWGAIR